jgi:primase-polymerase (primpol)-like protein
MSLNVANIPHELKEKHQWVNYGIEIRKGEETKIPKQPNGHNADSTNPATWSDFETCFQAFENDGLFDGIGFVFNRDYTGTDFDNCIIDGAISDPDIARYVKNLSTYTEYSQSGRGLHTINRATKPGPRCAQRNGLNGGKIEMYDVGRFFCMTGDRFNGAAIESHRDAVNDIYGTVFSSEEPASTTLSRLPVQLTNVEVIKKASEAKNGEKFKRLFFDGDISDYGGDDSSADMALCDMLAFWCGNDPIQIDSVFRESQLMRSKWDEKRGTMTYGERTKKAALELGGEVYQGGEVVKEPEQVPEGVQDAAMEILSEKDPIDHILKTYNKQHVGDRDIGEGILLGTAAQSVLNSLGVPSKLTGDSGKGKSHAARAMMHLHPQDYVLYASLTDKAAWYLDTLKPGMTIFSDDVSISPELEQIIKRATSNFQRETERVMPSRDRSKAITQNIPARLNWLLTSVSTQGSEELIKRQMGYDVDTSDAQDKAYIEFEKQRAISAVEEFPTTDDVLRCREIIRILKENEDGSARIIGIDIPFAERIVWTDTENRRNFNIFMDMVRSFAMLRFMQRERSDDGNIIATVDDFNDAKRHYGLRAGMQRLHLDEKQKQFCQHLAQEGGEADTATMQALTKLSRQSVYKIADQLENIYWRFSSEKRWVESDDSATKRTEKRFYVLNFDGRESFTIDEFSSVVHLKDEKDEL